MSFTPDERYFTDHAIIELCRQNGSSVFATRSKIKENSTGADFEWWIRDGTSVIGLLVQAKRLTMTGTGHYKDVDRVTDDGRPQPERLVDTARNRGMVPLYIFYNGQRPNFTFAPGPCGGKPALEARGTTVTAARHVVPLSRAAGDASLVDVMVYAIPWQCLVDCPVAERVTNGAVGIADVLLHYGLLDSDLEVVGQLDEMPERIARAFRLLEDVSSNEPNSAVEQLTLLLQNDAPAKFSVLTELAT